MGQDLVDTSARHHIASQKQDHADVILRPEGQSGL
jgi:hypothetical protein